MVKNKLRTGPVLNKLHNQEHIFKQELSKTFLEYLDGLPTHKRIEQIQSLLYDRNLPTSDRGLTLQEKRCLYLASQGKEIKEAASILGLSQRTIKYHRANIIKKLQVPNITAAVASSFQYRAHRNVDDLSLNTYPTFQMFTEKFQIIAQALDKVFNINVFLINQNGKIHWANDHMLKSICIPELHLIQGKHVSIFGDKPWINTKKVIKTRTAKILREEFEDKKYLTIKAPYFKNEFYGVMGLSIEVTNIKKTMLPVEL
ncbi:helix-turn-helix transcriptional regulator [Rickettsiella endosymbiont of Rhagonycha lignosa]|uniref:helix-turn-helix transcriptional regulator n=1 Tax=Rickettsiella endosymbiont of Rhagonycha lignosa TaxID=3077937 RepID=UPI00313B7C0A